MIGLPTLAPKHFAPDNESAVWVTHGTKIKPAILQAVYVNQLGKVEFADGSTATMYASQMFDTYEQAKSDVNAFLSRVRGRQGVA